MVYLQFFKESRELNLLILGETGVGKSTWINGFFNFLTFESLEDAEQHDMASLIPSSFTMTDDNFEDVVISTGKHRNENHSTGQSATQRSMVYPFVIGETLVRIIDTPGIGDVRGVAQDKVNMQNILSTLSNLEELHGIVILLKPNNARIGLMFRFCIKELLTHLHRSAVNNIVFGFTNSRNTLYKPGDTMPPLRKLLKENDVEIVLSKDTVYCFDSESYRILAALKHGIPFDGKTKRLFAESWNYSVNETSRLLTHISRLQPHAIKNTLTLNSARNLIVKLTKPIAEISRNIDINIALCQDKKREVKMSKKSGKELEADLLIKKIDLVPRPLNHPRTTCSNSACVKYFDKTAHYLKKCHPHCHLTGVTSDVLGHHGLVGCSAMDSNGNCGNCGHNWREHLHITYEAEEVQMLVEDKNVRSQIDKHCTDAHRKQNALNHLNDLIEEYRSEHKAFEHAAARFGLFLKVNAITPYNDAMIEYIDHLINEESGKVNAGGTKTTLESLRLSRASYEAEFKAIEHRMQKGANGVPMNPENVDRLVKDLFKLKHFGKTLETFKTVGEITAVYKEVPYVPPKTLNRPKSWWRRLFAVFY